jgi:hypothetical protein
MNNQKPFEFVFTQLSPEKFAGIFNREAPQTNAFILSFAEDEEYVKAVSICYLNNYRGGEFADLVKKGIKSIDSNFDMDFIRKVEDWVREMIDENRSIMGVRKSFFANNEE